MKAKCYYFGQCGYRPSLRDKGYWKSPNLKFKERKHLLNFGTVSKARANRIYFAAIIRFRNRLLSRATKIRLYKTLIRPVVTYGGETWTMTKKEEKAVLTFERKIFRRIYGLKYEDGEGKSRTNGKLEELSKKENIVK